MIRLLIWCGVFMLTLGCTNKEDGKRVLEQAGYVNVIMTGYRPMHCSEDDFFSDGFIATGPMGHHVSGVVCSGFLKGNTIRLD